MHRWFCSYRFVMCAICSDYQTKHENGGIPTRRSGEVWRRGRRLDNLTKSGSQLFIPLPGLSPARRLNSSYSSARVINVSSPRVLLTPQQDITTFVEVNGPIVINRIFESFTSFTTLNIEYLHPSRIDVYYPGRRVLLYFNSLA